jgi:hypothetical protein
MSKEKKFYSWSRWYPDKGQTEKNPGAFVVGFCDPNDPDVTLNQLPIAVAFPVSQRYDIELQEKRAKDYATYLNKLDEAAKVAYDQIHLVDILKR